MRYTSSTQASARTLLLHQRRNVLQEGVRTIHNIPPGPMLRMMNEQLADMHANGVQVEDFPASGPSTTITVHPKCILRVADFPGSNNRELEGRD